MDGVTFDQIYDALVTYRDNVHDGEGALTVPPYFVVPDCDPWPEQTRGLPLGKKIPTVRLKSYLKANPGAQEKLKKIGFEFDGKVAANDARYKKVYDALVRYKEINGDLLIPQPFVVPENNDWSEEMWGLRLGARVNAIRSQGTFVKTNPARKEELDELGFEWEPPSLGKKRGRRKKVVDDVLMGPAPPGMLEGGVQGEEEEEAPAPSAFADIGEAAKSTPLKNLPKDAAFSPASAFGGKDAFQLGYEQSQAMAEGAPQWGIEQDPFGALQAAVENEDEVQYNPPKNLTTSLKRAEEMAKSVGVIRGRDERNRVLKGFVEKQIPWFNDDFGGDFVFEDVVEALTLYKEIYGDFSGLDDDSFVVPDPTASIFGEDAGMSIDIEASARAAAAIAEAERAGGEASSETLIDAEIQRMEREMQSSSADLTDLEMEESASAAAMAAAKWPEHLAGMTLGSLVRRIRDGSLEVKHLPDRKAQLDAIDFDWGNPVKFLDIPFDKAMCAMFAYYLIRGDMFVYEDFVMLDEDPWPKALAGFELGKAVFRIRELQNFFEAYHPEKVTMLRMVEFIWFPEIALPLDPSKPEATVEDKYVVGLGHPLYHINMVPLGVIERIEAEGPWGPEDDQQKWYNYDVVKDYWLNEEDVDDPALYLRESGFEQLAREHEEKYGTSPFTDLEILADKLEKGIIDADQFEELKVDAANKLGEQLYNLVRRKYVGGEAAFDEEEAAFYIDADLGTVTEETIEIEVGEDESLEFEDSDVDTDVDYKGDEDEDEEEEELIEEEEEEEFYSDEEEEEEEDDVFGIEEEEI
uniref:Helicase-associated domain-containing protein n=1 Tax=Ditylum brightwellii TaxID=49249 RepID=A0A7S4SEJ8_9STRA